MDLVQRAEQENSDMDILENWLKEDTEFERFSRLFYREHGRPFTREEIPESFNHLYRMFPSDINNAFVRSHRTENLFSVSLGNRYLEHQFFLPGLDIFINKHTRYSDSGRHSHQFFEICYVYDGTCSNQFYAEGLKENGQNISLEKGDFLFIPPGQVHRLSVLSESTVLNIGIRRSTFEQAFSHNLPENSFLARFFFDALTTETPRIRYLHFHTGADMRVRRYVQELCLAYCTDNLYSVSMMNLQLGTLFLLLLQNFSAQSSVLLSGEEADVPNRLVPVIRHIEENYLHTSLKETARLFGFSPDYLNLLFRRATSYSVGEMIHRLKMQRAAELLGTSDMPVEAIAEYLNYRDVTGLTRSFKKYSGMTPAKYRKNRQTPA